MNYSAALQWLCRSIFRFFQLSSFRKNKTMNEPAGKRYLGQEPTSDFSCGCDDAEAQPAAEDAPVPCPLPPPCSQPSLARCSQGFKDINTCRKDFRAPEVRRRAGGSRKSLCGNVLELTPGSGDSHTQRRDRRLLSPPTAVRRQHTPFPSTWPVTLLTLPLPLVRE